MSFLVYVTMLSVSTVYCLLSRCCWPSLKNFAALKQFGVCDNKHFDFDLTLSYPKAETFQQRVAADLCMQLGIIISAVKRLKYLIAINRIYVIVNSKLIAINRTFLSILNVPSFIYFLHHFIFI